MKRMRRPEWSRTPYAGTTAKNTDSDIRKILAARKVADVQFTDTTGPTGRPAFYVRFTLRGQVFRVGQEVLDADVPADLLVAQARRSVYHLLKVLLEHATVFAPIEETLFGFMETPAGATTYEVIRPRLKELAAGGSPQLLLGLPPGPA